MWEALGLAEALAGAVVVTLAVFALLVRQRAHANGADAVGVEGQMGRTLVTCHFCHHSQWVYESQIDRWFCSSSVCGQYNGFSDDGGYNMDIREQYTPELNAAVVARGAWQTAPALLCDQCQRKQEQWLVAGREEQHAAPLCPSCAFDVAEELKMGYLNNTVAASRATPLPQTLATYPRRLVVALLLVLSALAAGLLLFGSLLWALVLVAACAVNRWIEAFDALYWSVVPADAAMALLLLAATWPQQRGRILIGVGALLLFGVVRREWLAMRDRRRKRVLSVPAEEDTIAPALAAQQREKLNEPTESSPAM